MLNKNNYNKSILISTIFSIKENSKNFNNAIGLYSNLFEIYLNKR